jgi:ankyrin repeat protein
MALRQGDMKMIQKLLDAGSTPQWDWICETMREGHLELAEMVLQRGVERNIFTMAAMGDVTRLTNRLRKVGADARLTASMEPASDRVTPLHVACASDWKRHGRERMAVQEQVAMILADHGADLNALARYRGISDATPLFCACWSSENVVLVRWLLDHGAAATDECLPAALGHLQHHGRGAYDIAEELVSCGLAVDYGVGTGRTLLQAFAHQGDHRAVAWLIAHGADVNARSSSGRNAVHYAAERNMGPKTLALLVEAGADLLARDAYGRRPLEIAKINEKPRLVEWIARRVRANRQ